MVTVSHIVGKIIQDKPFIQEGLAKGIINHAALAEELKPQIEKELKKKIKFSAVNMAIRRLSEKLENAPFNNPKFSKDSDITIKSDLMEITLFKTEEVQEHIKEIHDLIDFNRGDFLTITQGLHELMIITNQKHESEILKRFHKKSVKKKISSLSSLTINIPIKSINTVGLFHLITKSLAWENISIVDMVSTLTETTLIFNEEDTGKAFNVLNELIKKHQ